MPFSITTDIARYQPINETSAVQLHDIGHIVTGFDNTLYAGAEFIYLKGVASTVVGSTVVWDSTGQTALTIVASRGQVAVAMAACLASQWAWYQISGIGVAFSSGQTVVTAAPLQATASPGVVDDTTVAGSYIDGMVSKSASGVPASTFTTVSLNRPCMNGR